MVLVGQKLPDFTTAAVLANGSIVTDFNLYKSINNRYALILFYPLDFTFVCPSELIALNNKAKRFAELGVEIIAISIDSQYTHNAWRNTPIEQGGIGKLNFTLVADINHKICQSYGIEHPTAGVAFRATFIANKDHMVVHQTINDLPLGRNIDEFVRIIEALQHHEIAGEVCPAGWRKGAQAMQATSDGVANYLGKHSKDL